MSANATAANAVSISIPSGMSFKFVSDVVKEYLETALWSSTDDEGHPLDRNYELADIAAQSVSQAFNDVVEFLDSAGVDAMGLSAEKIGHNLWLNRNRHGAGFWDLGLGFRGERLSDVAHALGASDAYFGDDGSIHLS